MIDQSYYNIPWFLLSHIVSLILKIVPITSRVVRRFVRNAQAFHPSFYSETPDLYRFDTKNI